MKTENSFSLATYAIVSVAVLAMGLTIFTDWKIRENPYRRHSQQEIVVLTDKANAGDGDAALKLYLYYYWMEEDFVSAKKWIELAVKLGNEGANDHISALREAGVSEIVSFEGDDPQQGEPSRKPINGIGRANPPEER